MYPTIELTKEEYQKYSKPHWGSKSGTYGVVSRFYQDFAIKIWTGIEQEVENYTHEKVYRLSDFERLLR